MLKLNGVLKLAADIDVPKLGHVLLSLHKKGSFLCLFVKNLIDVDFI